MSPDPGRLTRAAIHCEAGEAELRITAAGNWQLAIRRAEEREWHLACSGDLSAGGVQPHPTSRPEPWRVGKLLIDPDAQRILVDEQEIELTRLQYALASTLASEPLRLFTKEELMQSLWGYEGIASRTLDTHASRLRVKLRRAGAPGYVINQQGVGYRLWDRASAATAGCPGVS
jgi:DNA-binding response OmpR family regulator